MYRRILVPLDGSALAEDALPIAIDLAKRSAASLVLVAVVARQGAVDASQAREPVADGSHTGREVDFAPVNFCERLARKYVDETAARLQLAARIKTVVECGDAASQIVETAEIEDVDLIVMTAGRRPGVTRGLIQSVSDHVVRSSSVPVLVAGAETAAACGGQPRPVTDVIVVVGGSVVAGSKEAALGVQHGEALATAYGARVVLFSAVNNHLTLGPAPGVGELGDYSVYWIEEPEEDARSTLDDLAGTLRDAGVEAEVRVSRGSLRANVAMLVTQLPSSIVVITESQLRSLNGWMPRSLTDGLVRIASAPFLVIHSPDSTSNRTSLRSLEASAR